MGHDLREILKKRCQAAPGRIGFPDSADVRILQTAHTLLKEKSVKQVSLYTPEAATLALAEQTGFDLKPYLPQIRWGVPAGDSNADRVNAAATGLAKGELDAVLGGNLSTTAEVIRAGIKIVGIAPGIRTVSGAFFMHRIHGTGVAAESYLFADCSVVIAPTGEQLVDIATESVRTWRFLQPTVPPVVAFLSFSTKGSARHPAQEAMATAAAAFKQRHPEVVSDGELQFDAAFDRTIGQRKAPGSPVPGRVNICIFPDLGAGNIAYKISQRLGGFEAYGPVLQGLAKPMNDLSRGATAADILSSAYITLSRAGLGA